MRRRDFCKMGALASALTLAGGCVSPEESSDAIADSIRRAKNKKCKFNMCDWSAPKIDKVRVGIVGLGERGFPLLKLWHKVGNVEITAICDVSEKAVKKSLDYLESKNLPKPKVYFGSEESWRGLCEQEDVDLVVNITPWVWHVPISIYAMECGKHTAVEVPAAITLEDCWKLVETSERTRKHCIQMENCCYDFFEIATIQMAKDGVFGKLVSGEGAYLHEGMSYQLPALKNPDKVVWRYIEKLKNNGNLYPTHGLGPLAWAFDINRGNNFDYMSSMQSDDFSMKYFAKENAHKYPNKVPPYDEKTSKFCGNLNTSMIRTKNGQILTIFYDIYSMRPYDRKHIISGTKGIAQKYPLPARIALSHSYMNRDKMNELLKKHEPKLLTHVRDVAKKAGGHGGMDYIMIWRIVDCLRNGLPMDMDVYDAAAWSSVFPLSVWSVANRSHPIDFPDFTCGNWQKNKPVDLSLRGGGNTAFVA